MDKKELQAIAQAAAKYTKIEDDRNESRAMLTKMTEAIWLQTDYHRALNL